MYYYLFKQVTPKSYKMKNKQKEEYFFLPDYMKILVLNEQYFNQKEKWCEFSTTTFQAIKLKPDDIK